MIVHPIEAAFHRFFFSRHCKSMRDLEPAIKHQTQILERWEKGGEKLQDLIDEQERFYARLTTGH